MLHLREPLIQNGHQQPLATMNLLVCASRELTPSDDEHAVKAYKCHLAAAAASTLGEPQVPWGIHGRLRLPVALLLIAGTDDV